jgi:hypothetical protein
VGVIKDILLLDYKFVSQLMVLLKCDWVTHGFDRWGNPTYKQDENGFLLANFCHLKANIDEPYVFLTQVQQVLYAQKLSTPWWKVVLHKELRFKQVVVENNENISIPINNVIDIEVLLQIFKVLSDITLVAAIELIGVDAIMVVEGFQRPSNDDEEEAIG